MAKVLELLEGKKVAGDDAAHLVGHVAVNVAPATRDELSYRLKDRSAPAWAKHLRNARGLIGWDHAQYIALVAIQDTLIEGLMDTGGACSIMDLDFATQLGLNVKTQT